MADYTSHPAGAPVKVENLSRIPTKSLRPLIEFVAARVASGHMARVRVLDGKPERHTGGLATKYFPTPEQHDLVTPSAIRLWLYEPGTHVYPRIERHVEELEAVVLSSWEEEVLLVLAHELRHIDQFWDEEWDGDDHAGEVDAEAFAIQVLKDWRSSRSSVGRPQRTAAAARAA